MSDQLASDIKKALADAGANRMARANARHSVPEGPSSSPQSGDLYVFPCYPSDQEVGVVWLLVRQDADDKNRFYALPADDYPEGGSADLKIPDGDLFGLHYLRSSFGLWVPRDKIHAGRRIGALHPTALSDVQKELGLLFSAQLDVDAESLETDEDPAYQSWLEYVAVAHDETKIQLHEIEPQKEFECPKEPQPAAWLVWHLEAQTKKLGATKWAGNQGRGPQKVRTVLVWNQRQQVTVPGEDGTYEAMLEATETKISFTIDPKALKSVVDIWLKVDGAEYGPYRATSRDSVAWFALRAPFHSKATIHTRIERPQQR